MATRLEFLERFKSAITEFVKTRKFTDRPGHQTKYHQTNFGIALASETRNAYRLSCRTSKPDQHLAKSISRLSWKAWKTFLCTRNFPVFCGYLMFLIPDGSGSHKILRIKEMWVSVFWGKKDSENCWFLRTSKNKQFVWKNRWLQRWFLACLKMFKPKGSVPKLVFICQACMVSRYN
jgi:hypothetical protein